MPDSNILAFLFSTVAVLVATLTGLIGAFSTFRLQRMDAKLDFLKDYLLHKEVSNAKTLNEKIRETGYTHIENIYLHNMAAVELLKQLVEQLDYHQHTEEYEHDILNIRKHQQVGDRVRKLTKSNFIISLCFVFVSIVLLVFTNMLAGSSLIWPVLGIFLPLLAAVFVAFIFQVKGLIA
ncbi:MAG TPA: hypothetical protein VFI33_16075 [Puia sp.]|nr:hypothetical protein [Puia sp.]